MRKFEFPLICLLVAVAAGFSSGEVIYGKPGGIMEVDLNPTEGSPATPSLLDNTDGNGNEIMSQSETNYGPYGAHSFSENFPGPENSENDVREFVVTGGYKVADNPSSRQEDPSSGGSLQELTLGGPQDGPQSGGHGIGLGGHSGPVLSHAPQHGGRAPFGRGVGGPYGGGPYGGGILLAGGPQGAPQSHGYGLGGGHGYGYGHGAPLYTVGGPHGGSPHGYGHGGPGPVSHGPPHGAHLLGVGHGQHSHPIGPYGHPAGIYGHPHTHKGYGLHLPSHGPLISGPLRHAHGGPAYAPGPYHHSNHLGIGGHGQGGFRPLIAHGPGNAHGHAYGAPAGIHGLGAPGISHRQPHYLAHPIGSSAGPSHSHGHGPSHGGPSFASFGLLGGLQGHQSPPSPSLLQGPGGPGGPGAQGSPSGQAHQHHIQHLGLGGGPGSASGAPPADFGSFDAFGGPSLSASPSPSAHPPHHAHAHAHAPHPHPQRSPFSALFG